jgi:hypothetical protein
MRPIIIVSFVLVCSVIQPTSLFAQKKEVSLPPVEEWQIRGILASLKDGDPQVRTIASKKLAELFEFDPEKKTKPREWRGKSRDDAMAHPKKSATQQRKYRPWIKSVSRDIFVSLFLVSFLRSSLFRAPWAFSSWCFR